MPGAGPSRPPGPAGLPRAVSALVRLLVPPEMFEAIEGDLAEQYRRISASRGRRAAAARVLRELFGLRPLALRRAVHSFRNASTPPRGDGVMRTMATELRLVLRGLARRPGSTALILTTLALALGGTTLLFSVVNGVLLRPLPFPEADRLIRVWQTNQEWMDSPNRQLREFAERFPASVPVVRTWRERSTAFESIGAYSGATFRYRGPERSEVLRGQSVTSGFFEVLGVAPQLGRTLVPAEDGVGSEPVAVLSHATWRDRFGSDPDVLGRTMVMNRTPYTVIGVMPEGFMFPGTGQALWASLPDDRKAQEFDSQFLAVVGRLRPGATLETGRRDIEGIQGALEEEFAEQEGRGARLTPLLESVVGEARSTLLFLLGSVGLVLLVACLNIANLLFGLGLRRRRELAVRAALGAGRSGLLRGSMLESAVLAAAGGAAGIGLAWVALPSVLRSAPPGVPRLVDVSLDPTVFGFGLVLVLATSLMVGTIPALQAIRTQPTGVLRSASGAVTTRGGVRTRRWLVVTEIALAFVLLSGAGLLGNSYARLLAVDKGFDSEGLVTLTVVSEDARFQDRDGRHQLATELRDELGRVPGVAQVTATNQVPLGGSTSSTSFQVERPGQEPQDTNVLISVVLENYFEVLGIPVIEGRGFTASDVGDAPQVAVASETLAQRMWPGESAMGKRMRDDDDSSWITIVGVARDVRHQSLQLESDPKLYVPLWQSGRSANEWVLETAGDPAGVMGRAREAVQAVSRDNWVGSATIVSDAVHATVALPRFRTLLVSALAGLSALLALLGIYGVMVFSVTERSREFGVRLAMGARPDQMVASVLRGGLGLAAAGLAIGLVATVLLGRTIRSFLFGIDATDPLTLGAIGLAITGVALAASWLPARRAADVDPVAVLNSE